MALIASRYRGQPILIEWAAWQKLPLDKRLGLRNDPDAEKTAFFKAHGSPKWNTPEAHRLAQSWARHVRPEWHPIGFGHHYVEVGGSCGRNQYWAQRDFNIDARLVKAPRRPDGSTLTEVYGYKLFNRRNDWSRDFVVLRYRVCTKPVQGTADCT